VLRTICACALAAAIGCVGCRATHARVSSAPPVKLDLPFVRASAALRERCRLTARSVGYAVPCPTLVPRGLAPTRIAVRPECRFEIVGLPPCPHPGKWRAWVVGSSEVDDRLTGDVLQHLVINASPRPLTDDAKVVDGPGWYRSARVQNLGSVRVNGRKMREVFVPPATNDGSAFMSHVVLIWTECGHTYAVGFHNRHGIQRTLRLDIALAQGIVLVGP
jgi:hypothetical protein